MYPEEPWRGSLARPSVVTTEPSRRHGYRVEGPFMPADTLIERDALIEQVAMAISRSAATRPRKEGTVMRFRRYAEAAVGVLEQHYMEKARAGEGTE